MEQQSYNCIITANVTPNEAFNAINSVAKWWSENIDGSTENLNDVFTIHFGDAWTSYKIVEFVKDKKVVWLVTDCELTWLKDKKEWKDTKISFEISTVNNSTQINFTHIGLVPEVECYKDCFNGWNHFFKGSLFKLLTEGIGTPDKKKVNSAV
jgi:hypothetical protein